MIEGEDWLFRPVMKGMIKAESLLDCSVDLAFIDLLNEAIEVEAENNHRSKLYQRAMQT